LDAGRAVTLERRFAFDVTGKYALPILASIAANVVAAVIIAVTSRPDKEASVIPLK
jgi:hypothetical protein